MATDLIKSYTRYDIGWDSSIADIEDQCQYFMYNLKDTLVTNCGAVVVSSSDSSVADASDNWGSAADLIWSTGAHSWIVLQLDSVFSGFQICIDLSESSYKNEAIVLTSAAGFTGGTTSARPTATDEAVCLNSLQWGFSNVVDDSVRLSIVKATDNSIVYVLFFQDHEPENVWIIGKAINGPSEHTTPGCVWIGGVPSLSTVCSNANIKTHVDGVKVDLVMSEVYAGGQQVLDSGQYYSYGFDSNEDFMLWGYSYISDTAERLGFYGYIPDLYLLNEAHTNLNYLYQSDGSSLGWVIIGDLAIPCGATKIPR